MSESNTPRTDEAAWIEADVVEASFARELETELALVTEQLDAAQKELAEKEDCIDNWMQEAMNFKKQRDRLAEALQKLADCDWVITPRNRMDAVRDIARNALKGWKLL